MSREDVTRLDLDARFDELKKSIPDAVKDVLTVDGRTKSLRVDRVWVEDMKPDASVDKAKLKDAKLHEGTWKIPVYADLKIVNKKTGDVVSESKKVRVADLPRPTPHQSFLIEGTEYHPRTQFRLRPGVYVRQKETGEVGAQFNFAKGGKSKLNFWIDLDPDAGIFYIRIAQAKVGLLPILSALGLNDAVVASAWGDKLLKANKEKFKNPQTQVDKLYRVIYREDPSDAVATSAGIKEYFAGASLDSSITKMTLGSSYSTVTPESLLAASRKMVRVNRGEEKQDDRDSLRFKEALTYDEHVVERLQKGKRAIQNKLKFRIESKETPKDAVIRADVNRPIVQHFTGGTGLASSSEQLNPLAIFGENATAVSTGEGGIQDMNIVTAAARSVHPSHAGFIDPIPTPQSAMAGVAVKLALGARKRGSELVTEVYDVKSKKVDYVSPGEIHDSVVALPDQYSVKGGKRTPIAAKVKALVKGEMQMVPSSTVRYVLISPKAMFSVNTNMLPFLASAQGNRALMASNAFEQVVPLVDPEAPLVQSHLMGGKSTEEVVGNLFSTMAPVTGKVTKVTKDAIYVKEKGGKSHKLSIYDDYPLNKGFITSKPVVEVGQEVKKGELLADTNFSKNGVVALGKNLRTGYLSFKGLTFEDAIVVSDTAASKLTSEHIHKFSVKLDENTSVDLRKHSAAFPNAMNAAQRDKLSQNGVVKKGQKVTMGDTLIAVLATEVATPEDVQLGRVYKKLARPWRDRSVKWTSEFDGVVSDVVAGERSVTVHVKTQEKLQEGDKLVGRHGNKGIVAKIVPDDEMPRDKDGDPIEIVMNPMGVPSRLNPSQNLETATGKAADKLGRPIVIDNFEEKDDNVTIAKKALKSAGLDTDKEELFDPETGASLGQIAVGKQHILKLEHQVSHKFSARARGAYDVNQQPTRGGEQGSGAVSHLEFNALLAHGARDFLKDVATIKGQQNEEYWRAVHMGKTPPSPQAPFVFDKLLGYLRGSGVNVEVKNGQMKALPMTDADVDKLTSGEIKKGEFLRAKDLREIPGGLFDESATGGVAGKRWAHITLAEPVMSPIATRAVKSLLDMTEGKVEGIASGKETIEHGGKTLRGGAAIKALLSDINVESELKKAKAEAKETKGTKLDKLNRKIRYLQALKDSKKSPQDAYVISKVPVVPPVMRPVYPLANGEIRPSGINLLYGDVVTVNNGLKELNELKGIPDDLKQESREELHKTVKALSGFGDPLETTKKRAGGSANIRGFSHEIRGDYPKAGFFQSKVWRRQQDLSARTVAAPNPDLGMDELEMPEEMAWKIYEPFIIKQLTATGLKPLDAAKEVKDRTEKAKAALMRAMESRPVAMTRAPALHKFSFMSFKPKIGPGDVVRTSPLVVAGFNLDHDGDTVGLHVPVSDAAVKDMQKMLPSRNLLLPSTGQPLMIPSMEGVHGLFLLTEQTGSESKTYASLDDAKKAVKSGELDPTKVVTIGGKKVTAGRAMVKEVLGRFYDGKTVLDKKAISALAKKISKEDQKAYADYFDKLLALANDRAYRAGFTVSIEDLEGADETVKKFFASREKASGKNRSPEKIVNAYVPHIKDFERSVMAEVKRKNPNNAFVRMHQSGSKGNPSQVRQILAAPVMVDGPDGSPVPVPIKNSYAQGLSLADYWTSSYGARKGVMDRSLQVQVPGVLAKRIIASSMSTVVTKLDCGTHEGTSFPVDSKECIGRNLASPQGGYSRNTVVTPQLQNALKAKGLKSLSLRGPLTCEVPGNGVCSKCYGVTENGGAPEIGANVGVESAQYMSEPTTQAQMRTFHSGGAVGDGFSLQEGFPAIQSLISLPKKMHSQATISTVKGTVEKVEKAPAGGNHVYVDGKKHYVPQTLTPVVKKGDRLKPGDRISTGLIHPQQLVELTDIRTAQNQMVDDLQDQYAKMGKPLYRRVIETVARGLTNWGIVEDEGDHPTWGAGDTVPLTEALKFNGTTNNPIQLKPVFKGMVQAPLASDDWIARLGATRLKDTIQDAPLKGEVSSIHGYHPIPAFAYGREFGEGEDGKY